MAARERLRLVQEVLIARHQHPIRRRNQPRRVFVAGDEARRVVGVLGQHFDDRRQVEIRVGRVYREDPIRLQMPEVNGEGFFG